MKIEKNERIIKRLKIWEMFISLYICGMLKPEGIV